MSFGLRTYDDDGNVTMDTSIRAGRIIGRHVVLGGAPAGSVNIPRLSEGAPFWIVLHAASSQYDRATVSLTGTVFSWSVAPTGFTILYGCF